jgi:hypothetical protein
MQFMSEHKGDGPAIARFLSALERLAYTLFLAREYPTERIGRYGSLLQAMSEGTNLFAAGSPLDITAIEKAEALRQLNGPLYLTRRLRLPVLLRLDELMSAGGAYYNFKVISVEHVLPQNPSEGSEWLRNFPEAAIGEEWMHRIGNLALLPFHKNTQAGNYEFAKKKEAYFLKKGTTPFALTTEIVSEPHWTLDVIKDRQRRLVALLSEEWKLGVEDSLALISKPAA